MARGRTLFFDSRRRAASVPAEVLSFPDLSTSSKLYNIKSHVAQDTDALMSASKRHDRDFLRNIQNKLDNPALLTKPPLAVSPTLNHNKPRLGPPPSRSAYYYAAASKPTPAPVSRDLRRRTWYGPTSSPVDDYEVAAYLAAPPVSRPYTRSLRAGSVPPVLPSRATAPRWYASAPGSQGVSVPRWPASSYPSYGRSYLQSHPDLEDIVVGVAPTALYGDIVIGIPYNKQHLFSNQHGLNDYPRIPVATRVTSPLFASRNKPLYDVDYEDIGSTPRRRATYSAPSRSYLTSTQYLDEDLSAPRPRISQYGLYNKRPVNTVGSSKGLYDLELSASKPPPSLVNLRNRANHALEKASQHKTMLERYMPVDYWNPGQINKGGPTLLASNPSPSLDVRSTGNPVSTTSGAPASVPFKPKISETRQRVRDLLCKSKNDPHYFD